MTDAASEHYGSLQQIAVDLTQEQTALRHLTKALHAEFAMAMAERDSLLVDWRGALRRHDVAPSRVTLRACEELVEAVRGTDNRLIELATIRREVRQYRRKVRRDASRASIYALRARRSLDQKLFAQPLDATGRGVKGKAQTRSFFHDMREHLTVAVLAAGKLGMFALTPRAAHFHDALIRGLTGLTEDLDVLNPVQTSPRPRPVLTVLPPPASPDGTHPGSTSSGTSKR